MSGYQGSKTDVRSVMIDSSNLDSFGRLRVSNLKSLLEISHIYNLLPRRMGLYRQDSGTTITHSSPTAILAVPAISGRKIVHQSHQYTTYLPGKSHLIHMTGNLGDGTAISGMGYGDDNDGIFLENTSTGLRIRFSSSTIDGQLIPQSEWNVDKLDGTGNSKITLMTNGAYHLIIDFAWLAVGRVRVGFDIGGNVIYAHQFAFSNTVNTAYMRTGSLPVRWYLESVGAASTMKAICASVSSDGGSDPVGLDHSIARTTYKTTLALLTRTPLISLRPKLTFNSLTNNVQIILRNISFLSSSADNLFVEIILNGTLTGASFASVNDDSHAESDQSATAISGGTTIFNDYVSSNTRSLTNAIPDPNLKDLPLTLSASGVQNTVTICVTRIENAANCYAGFNWREIR